MIKAPKPPAAGAATDLPYDELEDREGYADLQLAERALGAADGIELRRIAMRRVTWGGALLRRPDIEDLRLTGCDLSNAKWLDGSLIRVHAETCRLTGFMLSKCRVRDAAFVDCQAAYARFDHCDLKGVRFERCVLREASFEGCDLTGAVFDQCDLQDATFAGAKLAKADFRTSGVEGARLALEQLRGAVVTAPQVLALATMRHGLVVKGEDEA